jgi:UDP-glucose 4-epimerase
MISLVEQVTGRPVPVRHLPARPIDVATIVLDCTRIRRDLGWMAVRPIEATIADVWSSTPPGHAQLRTARGGLSVA